MADDAGGRQGDGAWRHIGLPAWRVLQDTAFKRRERKSPAMFKIAGKLRAQAAVTRREEAVVLKWKR